MPKSKLIELRKEFEENRTSWKFFARKRAEDNPHIFALGVDILLEILKELQYLNDSLPPQPPKKSKGSGALTKKVEKKKK